MESHLNTFLLLFLVTIFFSYSPQLSLAQAPKSSPELAQAPTNSPEHTVAQGPGNETELLSTACQHASQKDFCVSMLQSDPNFHTSDLRGLGLIALHQASSNASDISEHIKTLLNDSSLEPAVQDGVAECLEHYLDAAEQLDDSVAALLANAHTDVENWVNVAVTDAVSCDAALSEGNHEAVLWDMNNAFRKLCDNALAINKVLAQQRTN